VIIAQKSHQNSMKYNLLNLDESECLMDRFSGIIYFNFVGLSAFVLLSFTVISLLCKAVFVGHYRNLKWCGFLCASNNGKEKKV